MTSISILDETAKVGAPRYRASSGGRQSYGSTAGEALDRLLSQADSSDDASEILIQRFVPDAFFNAQQIARMRELQSRLGSLSAEEHNELTDLIGAEVDATVTRAESVFRAIP